MPPDGLGTIFLSHLLSGRHPAVPTVTRPTLPDVCANWISRSSLAKTMPPGEELDRSLRTSLHRSKLLVVIVNQATLERPGWIRKEVEEYRKHCSGRPIIPISVSGVLLDPTLATATQEWLGFEGKIWVDEG